MCPLDYMSSKTIHRIFNLIHSSDKDGFVSGSLVLAMKRRPGWSPCALGASACSSDKEGRRGDRQRWVSGKAAWRSHLELG